MQVRELSPRKTWDYGVDYINSPACPPLPKNGRLYRRSPKKKLTSKHGRNQQQVYATYVFGNPEGMRCSYPSTPTRRPLTIGWYWVRMRFHPWRGTR